MKFNYVEPKIDVEKLNYIGRGVLFRPANSLDLYIKTDMIGDDDVFTESENRLLDFYENYTDNDYECANDLVACVCIEDGTLRFLHRDCRVIVVNYDLNVEGGRIMAKCPHCNIDLEVDDTYDTHYDTDFNMTLTLNQIGHCPRCDRNYQWDECYDLENRLVEGLSEV